MQDTHSGVSHPSAEMQSMYSRAVPSDLCKLYLGHFMPQRKFIVFIEYSYLHSLCRYFLRGLFLDDPIEFDV